MDKAERKIGSLAMVCIPLQIITIILKITHVINWNWVQVFSPTIAYFLIIGFLLALVGLIVCTLIFSNRIKKDESTENKKEED